MQRLLHLLLALALLATLTLPVSAAGAEDRLTQVTLKVKETLGIGDKYDTFSGDLQESIRPFWSLHWSGGEQGLEVVAGEDGKIYQFYRYREGSSSSDSSVPSLPAVSRSQAQEAAQAFLDKVLTSGESVTWNQGSARPGDRSYFFSGTILLHNLPSPFTFSLDVSTADASILSFSRSDLDRPYEEGVPSPTAQISPADAGSTLRTTLQLRLEYVRDGEEKNAVLRYLPELDGEYYVDAASGELVNLSALYQELDKGAGSTAEENATASPENGGLSQAEQEGIAKLEGVQSKEALDQLIRAQTALGLEGTNLSAFAYSTEDEEEQVLATLTYTRPLEEGFWRRRVTVDARTGAVETVSSSRPRDENAVPTLTLEEAQATAEAYVNTLWNAQMKQSALYHSADTVDVSFYSFQYAQQVNGYFFPEHDIQVEIDPADGTIAYLSHTFDETVTFDSADNLITPEAAMDAYFSAYTVTLGYQAVPVALDPNAPEAAPLLSYGYSYSYALRLGYTLESESSIRGVDAKTGAVLVRELRNNTLTYDDLEGCWGKNQALTLAEYGVGWQGGSLRPNDTLTQLDLVALLASTHGYSYSPDEDDANDLYAYAYRYGILTPEQRQDAAQVTRLELVQLLLDSAGYGNIARLEGIYRCDYTDANTIPAGQLGYAALAQGLGLVAGDSAGRFAPDRPATRVEAIAILYQFMIR